MLGKILDSPRQVDLDPLTIQTLPSVNPLMIFFPVWRNTPPLCRSSLYPRLVQNKGMGLGIGTLSHRVSDIESWQGLGLKFFMGLW
jgi:hypothetical protein